MTYAMRWQHIMQVLRSYLKNGSLEYSLSINGRLRVSTAGGNSDHALRVRYDAVPGVNIVSKQLQHLTAGVTAPLAANLRDVQLQQVVGPRPDQLISLWRTK